MNQPLTPERQFNAQPIPRNYQTRTTDTDAIEVLLSCDRRRGLWSSQYRVGTGRPVRFAGQTPTDFGQHTLLAIALTSALKQLSKRQLLKVANGSKPRVEVVADNMTFGAAVASLQSRQNGKPLKTNSNFRDELIRQLQRVDAQFVSSPDGDTADKLLKLGNWTRKTMFAPAFMDQAVALFNPVQISE